MEIRPFKQRASFNIGDRISGLLLEDKETSDRVFVSDWSGTLQILKFEKQTGPDPKVLRKYKKENSSNAILSIDKNHSTDGPQNDKILIGESDGSLDCYHLELNKCVSIGKDNYGRPISKVFSVEGSNRIFSFSWDRVMQTWDSREKTQLYTTKLPENFITAEYLHPYIVAVFGNNSIAFINVETYSSGNSIRAKQIGHDELIRSIALTDSLNHIAFGDIAGTVKVLKKNIASSGLGSYSTKDSLVDEDYSCIFEGRAHSFISPNRSSEYSKALFPANALDFHPKIANTVFSAGGDGYIFGIDYEDEKGCKQNEFKIKGIHNTFQNPISHLKFNRKDGRSLLVAETQEKCFDLFNDNFNDKPLSTIRMLEMMDSE